MRIQALPEAGVSAPFKTLVLSVKAKSWRQDVEPADAEFASVRPMILERDKNTCRYCGFSSGQYQQVHHLDDDHRNNDPSNLVVICSYCHMNFHIGKAGQDGAMLAFIPELTAQQISHLWRAIGVAYFYGDWLGQRSRQGKVVGHMQALNASNLRHAATKAYEAMLQRTILAEKLLGTKDPVVLGDVLLGVAKTSQKFYDRREEWLHGIRLLPPGPHHDFGGRDMYMYFMDGNGPFSGGLSPASWLAMLKSADSPARSNQ